MSEPSSIIVQENKLPAPYVPNITTVQSVMAIVDMAYRSGMVKVKNIDDARFIALYGLELSIPVMTSLRCIYSVNGGAPTCSGELLLALIRRSGKVSVKISSTEETLKAGRATVYMKRLDSGDEFTASWGKEDDTRAQLKSNRDKYPAQMWTWRAVSIAAKALCSDIVGGMYTHEEIYPEARLSEDGEIIVESLPAQLSPSAVGQPAGQGTPTQKQPPVQSNLIDDTKPWLNAKDIDYLVSRALGTFEGLTVQDVIRYIGFENLKDLTDKGWGKFADAKAAGLAIKEGVEKDAETAKNAPPATTKAKKWNMTDLEEAVKHSVYAGNVIHMRRSISKLVQSSKLPPVLTLEQAVEVVKTRKDEVPPADSAQEDFDNLPSEFDKTKEPPVPVGNVPF